MGDMRLLPVCALGLCLLTSGCRLWLDEDFPESARPFVPPPKYRVWWELVESCSGRQVPFESVAWFKVPVGELVIRGETAAGAWFVFGNRIAMVDSWSDNGPVVRHEMLHAILETGDHPKDYFREKCGDEIAYSLFGPPPPALEDGVAISPYALHADAVLFPARPSLSAYNGRVTIVVRVRNPTNRNAYLDLEWNRHAHCAFGFMLSSATDPQRMKWDCSYLEASEDGRIYFRPGETRRIVFEVLPTYGGRIFPAEPVNLSAIVADNLRRTTTVRLLP